MTVAVERDRTQLPLRVIFMLFTTWPITVTGTSRAWVAANEITASFSEITGFCQDCAFRFCHNCCLLGCQSNEQRSGG